MGSFLSSFIGGSHEDSSASSKSPDNLKAFHSYEHLNSHLDKLKETPSLVVIDFTASWCGPCRIMEPIIHDLAIEFKDVQFIKIDVDELSDAAHKYEVQAMPTFVLLKKTNGIDRVEIDRVVGAKKDELKNKIQNHRA